MKLYISIFLLLLISCNTPEESEPVKLLKENAIAMKDLSTLNHNIYNEIKDYDVIMIGELHGTREPSELAFGMCSLIAKNEHEVFLELEIPPSQMEGYTDDMSLEQLMELDFFKSDNTHGMNGEAWLELIYQCNRNKKIKLRFMDTYTHSTRDSSMYNDILAVKQLHPNSKIVTLSGNVHNMIKKSKFNAGFGNHLMNDTINFDSNKIMSINHIYKKGTMLNNIGNGLELTTIEGEDNIFNTTIESEMYMCKNISNDEYPYTHFFYTERVTHSETINFKSLKN